MEIKLKNLLGLIAFIFALIPYLSIPHGIFIEGVYQYSSDFASIGLDTSKMESLYNFINVYDIALTIIVVFLSFLFISYQSQHKHNLFSILASVINVITIILTILALSLLSIR